MTHYIALTCSALARSVYAEAAQSQPIVSVRLYDQGLHNVPKNLRARLQTEINSIEFGSCEAILLAYGTCGLATIGLKSHQIPLVLPRAHDCITLYLGSQKRYQEEFDAHPGTYWYSQDYLERNPNSSVALGAASIEVSEALYHEYVGKYGRENADYLMEAMGEWGKHYDRAVYIDTGLDRGAVYEQIAREQAKRRSWQFERKEGDPRLLKMLLNGEWSASEFLFVPPNHAIAQAVDGSLVQAVPLEEKRS